MRALLGSLGFLIWGVIVAGLLAALVFVGYGLAARRLQSSEITTPSRPDDSGSPGNVVVNSAAKKAGVTGSRSSVAVLPAIAMGSRNFASGETVATSESRVAAPVVQDGVFGHTYQGTDWRQFFATLQAQSRNDHDVLMVYRLMCAVGAMESGAQFRAMSRLLVRQGLYGEAQQLLQYARWGGHGVTISADLVNPSLIEVDAQATALYERLPQLEEQSGATGSGVDSFSVGELQFGYRNYGYAATAIKRALQQGLLERRGDALILLGLSELIIGHENAAQRAFAGLEAMSGENVELRKWWVLYAKNRSCNHAAPITVGMQATPLGRDLRC